MRFLEQIVGKWRAEYFPNPHVAASKQAKRPQTNKMLQKRGSKLFLNLFAN